MQTLKALLENRYELICFEDIGNHVRQHKDLFNLMKLYKRDEFHANQILVLYTSHDPDQLVIDHIQRAASKVDVPNFFILICCPHDISDKLKIANQKFGVDDVPMIAFKLIDPPQTAELTPNGIYPPDSLCPSIFGQLSIGIQGDARPCCAFKETLSYINDNSIKDLLTHQMLNEVRTDIKEAKYHKSCSACWRDESLNVRSSRQHVLSKFPNADFYLYDDVQLRCIQLSPSNRCNFHCRICDALASSKIAQEKVKFEGLNPTLQINLDNSNWTYRDNLAEDIANYSDTLEYLHLFGGEPTVIKEFPAFIDKLTSLGNTKNTNIELNTNGSTYRDDINNLVSKFKNIEIFLSIDDTGRRFEIQRGGHWDQVHSNIKKYAELNTQNNVTVNFTVSVNIQNVLYLEQLIEIAGSLNLGIIWTYVNTPVHMSIDSMTDAAKQLVHDRYINSNHSTLKNIAERVINSCGSDGVEFIKYQQQLDLRRDEDFGSAHPEIWKVMGGNLPNTLDF